MDFHPEYSRAAPFKYFLILRKWFSRLKLICLRNKEPTWVKFYFNFDKFKLSSRNDKHTRKDSAAGLQNDGFPFFFIPVHSKKYGKFWGINGKSQKTSFCKTCSLVIICVTEMSCSWSSRNMLTFLILSLPLHEQKQIHLIWDNSLRKIINAVNRLF